MEQLFVLVRAYGNVAVMGPFDEASAHERVAALRGPNDTPPGAVQGTLIVTRDELKQLGYEIGMLLGDTMPS